MAAAIALVIAYCFQKLLDFLGRIWEFILRSLQYALKWVLENLVYKIIPDLSTVSGNLPENVFDFGFVSPATIGYLNEWFPVDYAVTCLISYVIIASTVYLINWILGLIPTVS